LTTKKDVIVVNLTKEMALERAEWKKRIHVANPNSLGKYRCSSI